MEKLLNTVNYLHQQGIANAEIGIVLGTGLGNLVTRIEIEKEISYSSIPDFPVSTVESHQGKLIYGTLGGKKIIAMQGRFHYYEGYSMDQIVFPVRVMKKLGIRHLLLSNASGCLNLNWKKGELMMIDDHINLQPTNPLIGTTYKAMGPMFPDMSEPYCRKTNALLRSVADKLELTLREGVYVSVPGPMLETRAEYRFLKMIGADAVGMSTVPEVIAARHMSLPCTAVSVLTDECDPDHLKPVSIDEIIAVAAKAEVKLTLLFEELIKSIQ
ncbi:MAG: purine-nucleoside phosphorylase [Bacteroidota bacterium]